jgi:hypothetical protein
MTLHANARLSLKGRELLIDRVESAGWSLTQDADHKDRALLDGPALMAAVVELADRCTPAR